MRCASYSALPTVGAGGLVMSAVDRFAAPARMGTAPPGHNRRMAFTGLTHILWIEICVPGLEASRIIPLPA